MPVFLPEKSHGLRSLVGYGSWGHQELDMTEATDHTHMMPSKYSNVGLNSSFCLQINLCDRLNLS